jgi:D-xylose transport system ATP-binding protein
VSSNILSINDVTKEFPGIRALTNVSFQVGRGTIHGLCGENGAGKSTLMKILSGVYPHGSYSGKILMEDNELTNTNIHGAIEKGIAIVYQELALIPKMTVGENIFLGREPRKFGGINWDKLYQDTEKILKKYGLDIPSQEKIINLSVGKQQMVEIAKALSENAKVLILDEPTSALTEKEVKTLMGILHRLKENGVTCIYISHKLEEFFEITDTITVLRDGKVVNTVTTAETNIEKLISMMVGRDMAERFPAGNRRPNTTIFEVNNFSIFDPDYTEKKKVDNVSFDVKEGEILGIAGLMGSGRSELVMAIFGEYGVKKQGQVIVNGKQIHIKSAADAMAHKISLVPEDRKGMGLVIMQSILKNIALPNLNRFAGFARINKLKELHSCEKISKEIAIKAPNMHVPVDSLSGGNQQKVVIAKWLISQPKILILDEPTRGIDVGAKFEIYKLMNQLAEQGVAIIMVSSELPEILGMSDRILVMCEGKCTGIVDKKDATEESLMTLATGMLENNK